MSVRRQAAPLAVIFTRHASWGCLVAREILHRHGFVIHEVDLDSEPERRSEMHLRTGHSRTVPQVLLGNAYVGGLPELRQLDTGGTLIKMRQRLCSSDDGVAGFVTAVSSSATLAPTLETIREEDEDDGNSVGGVGGGDDDAASSTAASPRCTDLLGHQIVANAATRNAIDMPCGLDTGHHSHRQAQNVPDKLSALQLEETYLSLRCTGSGVLLRTRFAGLRRYKLCFSGADIVQNLMGRYGANSGAEATATAICQQLFRCRYLIRLTPPLGHFDATDAALYSFAADLQPRMLNMSHVWLEGPPHPVATVVDKLFHSVVRLARDSLPPPPAPPSSSSSSSQQKSQSNTGGRLQTLQTHTDYVRFSRATLELQLASGLDSMTPTQRKALFLNLYTVLYVHACIVSGVPETALQQARLERLGYVIGGFKFSLAEMLHGVLRANGSANWVSTAPTRTFRSPSDLRLAMVLPEGEPRAVLAVYLLHRWLASVDHPNNDTGSAPPPVLYTEQTVETQLDETAERFVTASLMVAEDQQPVEDKSEAAVNTSHPGIRVLLPKSLEPFRRDFGVNDKSLLRFFSCYHQPLGVQLRPALEATSRVHCSVEWVGNGGVADGENNVAAPQPVLDSLQYSASGDSLASTGDDDAELGRTSSKSFIWDRRSKVTGQFAASLTNASHSLRLPSDASGVADVSASEGPAATRQRSKSHERIRGVR